MVDEADQCMHFLKEFKVHYFHHCHDGTPDVLTENPRLPVLPDHRYW